MRAAILAVAIACGVGSAAQAAVFNLTSPTYNSTALALNATTRLELVISDAAVARGSFNLQEIASNQIQTLAGDVADFVSLSIGKTITPTSASFANVAVSLTFSGIVPTGSITFLGDTGDLRLSGTAGVFSGTFGSDRDGCPTTGFNTCGVTGTLAASPSLFSPSPSSVPEPATLALFGTGLLGLLHNRRRVG